MSLSSHFFNNPGALAIKDEAETKVIDFPVPSIHFTSNTTTGVVLPCATLRGTGDYQHVGNRIINRRLDWNLRLIYVNATPNHTVGEETQRFIIAYDRQYIGVRPVITDVLQDTDINGNLICSAYSGFNNDNQERWLVLADYTIPCPLVGNNLSGQMNFVGPTDQRHFVSSLVGSSELLKGLPTFYRANSANVPANYSTGAVIACPLSTNGSLTLTNWVLTGSFRLYYQDY